MARTLLDMLLPQPRQQPTTLAALGQSYRDYPAASFDERFGPYTVGPHSTGPMTDRDMMRLYLQQLLPDEIMPGTPSWPSGFIRI